jgi:hypothetical protein
MSAEKALFDAYREWNRLAKAENRAICQRDWDLLGECQQLLKNLQPLITRLTGEANDEWEKSGADCESKRTKLRKVVAGLIELARKNQMLLNSARESALAKGRQLEAAGRNLKRVQNSYVSAQPAGWVSFS